MRTRFTGIFLLPLLLVCGARVAPAQTTVDAPKFEIFAGYSNLQAEGLAGSEQNEDDSFDDEVFGDRQGLNGFNVAATGFISETVGITGDFSFNQKRQNFELPNQPTGTTAENETRLRVLNFLGGPTVKFRNESRVTPFVHALAGVAHTKFEAETATTTATGTQRSEFETGSTDFALALGGGLDVRLTDRLDLRLIQLDWNPVFLGDQSIQRLNNAGTLATQTLEGQRADNVRISIGVVFK